VSVSTVCFKKIGPLRLIWHNFTNSQHLLIIFDRERERERDYTILNSRTKKCGFNNYSWTVDLNSGFLSWLPTTYLRQGNKRVATGPVSTLTAFEHVVTFNTAKHFIIPIKTLFILKDLTFLFIRQQNCSGMTHSYGLLQ